MSPVAKLASCRFLVRILVACTTAAYLAAGAAVWALDRLYRAWDRTDSAGSSSVGTRWVPVAAETRAAEENVKPDAELSGMVESAVPEPAA